MILKIKMAKGAVDIYERGALPYGNAPLEFA